MNTKTNIYLLIAEHFSIPGTVVKAFASKFSADTEAAELANIMLKDSDLTQNATAANWEVKAEELEDYHGGAHCYIRVDVLEVKP